MPTITTVRRNMSPMRVARPERRLQITAGPPPKVQIPSPASARKIAPAGSVPVRRRHPQPQGDLARGTRRFAVSNVIGQPLSASTVKMISTAPAQRRIELRQCGRPQHHAGDVADEHHRQDRHRDSARTETGERNIQDHRVPGQPQVVVQIPSHQDLPGGCRRVRWRIARRGPARAAKRRRRRPAPRSTSRLDLYQRVSTHLLWWRGPPSGPIRGARSAVVAQARSAGRQARTC